MTTTAPSASPSSSGPDPIGSAAAAGVGARITLSVMSDDYVAVITDALAAADSRDLLVETDSVSTFIRGSEQRLAEYLTALVATAGRSGHHVVATVLLSKGCPGEVCGTAPPRPASAVDLPVTGVPATAQWSLYPLFDPGAAADGDGGDHLAPVWAAIERARERGTFLRADHYVTTLRGDLAEVLGTVVDTWTIAGTLVGHVTSHVTIGINSPSADLP